MANLEIIITGENQSGAAFDSLKKDTGEVEKGLESAGKTGGGFFSNLLSTAGGFLAANVLGSIAGQLTSFVTDGVAAAQDTAKLMAQTETIIKNTGGAAGISAEQVADLATSLSDAAGKSLFGDDQIQGAENVLLKYKELKGIIPGVTTLAVDMAASLGKDPAAAAEFLGRALQKPFDAASKLAKEGIVLTDSQKATLEAFKKTGDTAGAQAFLMEQLNGTYKGSAEAQAKAAGGMVQFKARLGEVGESLGAMLIPVLNKVASLLNDYVAPVVENVIAVFGNLVDSGGDLGVLAEDMQEVFGIDIYPIINAFQALKDMWADNVTPALEALSNYFTTILVPALATVWAFIQDNIIPIIDELVKVGFAILKADIQALSAIWVNVLWPALQKVWAFIDKNVIPIIASLIVWFKNNLPPALKALSDLWTGTLLPAITAVWNFIDTKVLPVLKAIGDVINATLVVAFKLIAGTLTTTVIPALEKMYKYFNDNILPILKTVNDAIRNTAGPAFEWLGTKLSPLIGFFAGLLTNIKDVVTWLENLASKISSISIPSWAGGSGGSGKSSGSSNSGGNSLVAGKNFTSSGGPVAQGAGGVTYIFNFNDSVSAYDRDRVERETRSAMDAAGNKAYNRMRTGG